MTPREIAHATAMKWMPESAPDSGKLIALMAHIEAAIKTALTIERNGFVKLCREVATDAARWRDDEKKHGRDGQEWTSRIAAVQYIARIVESGNEP